MVRIITAAAVVLLLAACEQPKPPPRPVYDAAEISIYRANRFDACLSMIPPGPAATQYNDWAEVIETCGQQAYYQTRTRFPGWP